ncbi:MULTISPECIES: NUDIX hydrolase [Streptomyces]|uniref:NUDIX hydrolase n=1 Tax=Streptomyces zinciresistens K42 TaxID=700597 RepID=G2G740_9ACTN|nr:MULTISPECIES: NUDIX hydrolase [Streptomyces]EGX60581.1 NUDIX hydrolase [Streptomyces zinciresistens K42]MDT9695949.1 NUDIX hydrolase [Streptomyces sp. P17]
MAPAPARPTQSAAAVVRDAEDRVLIVKPGYKDGWNLPGGGVDEGETPSQAAARELREEVGVEQVIGRLLVSAYIQSEAGAHIYWVFDGGVISEEQKSGIRLQESELVDYRFKRAEEIGPDEIPPAVRAVWDRALQALRDGTALSLEVVR